MKVVGLVSAYKEGRLVRGALESLQRIRLDDLIVYEGPAGEVLSDKVPDSEYEAPWPDKIMMPGERGTPYYGHWRTDARKRDAMLQEAKRRHPGPLWGVWLDGDEILGNGEYLRDRLQWCQWEDEANPDKEPWARWPLRLIEADGRMSLITGRVVRLDLIRSYDVSTSVITNEAGIRDTYGNVPEDSRIWIEHFLGAIDKGMMTAWPPLPCEPYIFHRSHLRHPARRGNRMHVQEAAELEKLRGDA